MKVKAKKVEETTSTNESENIAPETVQKNSSKDKKSPVAIIWSPKDEKKDEVKEEKESSPLNVSKFVSRDESAPREHKKTPFVPRVSFSPAPTSSAPVKKEGNETPFVFVPRSSEGGNKEKKVFGNNKPKGGSGKSPFSFGERHGGRKTLKVRGYAEDDGGFRRSGKVANFEKKEKDIDDIKQTLTDKTGQEITIPEVLTVKEFSEKIGVPLVKIITELMKNGMMVTINTKIDFDTCFLIGEIFGIKITKEISTKASVSSLMDGNIEELLKNDDVSKMITRAPIVSVMGHVDH